MPAEEYLTKKEVEAKLRLHRNTVTRLLAAGRFPGAFRAGQQWRIPAGDVEIFIHAAQENSGHSINGEGRR